MYLRVNLFVDQNHFGQSGSGHYVTYALSKKDKQWYCDASCPSSNTSHRDVIGYVICVRYCFDDSRVTPIEEKDVIRNSAYMLFYQRQGNVRDGVRMRACDPLPTCMLLPRAGIDDLSILPDNVIARAKQGLDENQKKLLQEQSEPGFCWDTSQGCGLQ